MVGVGFSTLVQYFQAYGVMDFLLPFILVFTIIFAVTARLPLFQEKKFRVVISIVLALFFVIPHIIGVYPLGYDPVQVMNESLPSISLVAVAVVMLMLLMGLFGTQFSEKAMPFLAIISIAFVCYIFGASLGFWQGPYDVFPWWSSEITELMIMIIVFGLIVWLIVREPTTEENSVTKALKGIGSLFEGISGEKPK
ncbi:MAG: hypothetical protein KJ598_01110 [Nanoarchaeota archaeon]|nr:hypothetical protein [Nanoarchaeota archaeon]